MIELVSAFERRRSNNLELGLLGKKEKFSLEALYLLSALLAEDLLV